MAKQSFVTGQVLTAQQVNDLQTNDFNQTVSAKTASYTLVAADKGTRITMSSTSATTITVNTSLFSAGDTLFIQNLNTGVSTITAGTATVTTASSLALAQWEGGTLYFTSASAAIFFKSDGAAAAAGGDNFTLLNSGGTALTGADIITVSGISGANKIQILVENASASASSFIGFRLNGATSNYKIFAQNIFANTTWTENSVVGTNLAENSLWIARLANNGSSSAFGGALITGANSSGVKIISGVGMADSGGGNTARGYIYQGYYDSSSAITSVAIHSNVGNFDAGTIYVYTSA